MNWSGGSAFDHTGSDDEDDDRDDPYQRPYTGSTQSGLTLSQSLLSIAQRWESDKERELSTQRRMLAEANANLRSERTKNLQAQNTIGTLKTEHERALSAAQQELKLEKDRVRELTEANRLARTHSFGSWLLLAELRTAALAHLPALAPAKAALEAPASTLDGGDDADDADDGDDAEGDDGDGEGGDEGGDGRLTKAQKKKLKEKRQKERKKAAAAAVADDDGDDGDDDAAEDESAETPSAAGQQPQEETGELVASGAAEVVGAASSDDTPLAPDAAATAQLRSLVSELPPLAGTDELLGACRDGRTRLVTESLEAPPPLLDALRTPPPRLSSDD